MSDRVRVVGIDVAARRPCVAVALEVARSAAVVGWMEADQRHLGETAGLLDWIQSVAPAVVAIDAPQAVNRRLIPNSTLRVCDWELRRRGLPLYQVPVRGDVAPPWMAVGFELFKLLRRRGFELPTDGALPLAFGQAPALLEVYPYATFVALWREAGRGGDAHGAPSLPKKGSRDGARLRVELLRAAKVEWSDYYDHDSLDALAAALTARRYLQGKATGLGDSREGLLWVPLIRESLDALLPPRS